MIKVLLVDDHAVVREGLRAFLELQDGIEVVGEAENGVEAIQQTERLRPDVILMDFRMTGLDGYTAARAIVQEFPQVKVFMLTAFPGALDREKVARSGLEGLLVKDQPAAEIIEAIRSSVGKLES